jgi:dienelactone hydrolase
MKFLLKLIYLLVFCSNVFAQNFKEQSQSHSDLSFPSVPVSYSVFRDLSNKLFKPDAQLVKYPVIVLLHSCSGVKGGKTDEHLREWLKSGLERGYMVYVMDSLRGSDRNCKPRPVPEGRLFKDAIDLAEHLSKLDFVDANRLYTVGFSLGAQVGSLLASPGITNSVAPNSKRYRATVGLYGGCEFRNGQKYVYGDTDRPLLWMMGSADTETPPEDCVRIFETLKKTNSDVVAHTYEGATHCWDCKELNGFSKTANNGRQTTYKYNSEYSEDSKRRTFDFFEKYK